MSNNLSDREKVKPILDSNCVLYFPPNRFEEPAWLNVESLLSQANYSEKKGFANISDRRVVVTANLHRLKNWILDIAYDAFLMEQVDSKDEQGNLIKINQGRSTNFFNAILIFLRLLYPNKPTVRLAVGHRLNRQISMVMAQARMIALRSRL